MATSHPKGLYLIFFTGMSERFSYYGMRALFVLYMTKALFFDKALSSQIYGSYTGLVYLTPLIGGYIADKYWGNQRSIVIGGLLMAIGQLLLFFSGMYYQQLELATWLLMGGLGFLIFGNGFFKPNISSMVGQLYPPGDKRLDSAFTIFYMGVNVGAFIAPLACGFVGDTGNPADFKWGFLLAAIGMLMSVILFVALKDKWIVTEEGKPVGLKPSKKSDPVDVSYLKNNTSESGTNLTGNVLQTPAVGNSLQPEVNPTDSGNLSAPGFTKRHVLIWSGIGSLLLIAFYFLLGRDLIGAFVFALTIAAPGLVITDPTLTKTERERIWVIFIVAFFVIFFWAAFEQAGASLTYFAEEQTNRELMGSVIPTSYFQSINAVGIVIFAPIFVWIWGWLGKRNWEPASPYKQSIGLFLLAIGYLVIAFGVKGVEPGTKVSMMWLISLYTIHTFGELALSPIGLSMVNKLSPIKFASLLMGVWYLSMASSNIFAGTLSGLYPEPIEPGSAITHVKHFLGFEIASLYDFFMLFVVLAGVASIILFFLSRKLVKMMNGVR